MNCCLRAGGQSLACSHKAVSALRQGWSLPDAYEALAKVGFDLRTQMYVLSSTVKEYSGTWVVQNVSKRDPDLIHQLGGFKVQHDSWVEPKCTK